MSFPKLLVISSFVFVMLIGGLALFKGKKSEEPKIEEIVIKKKSSILPAEIDHINRLFTTDETKFPFVETVSYTSRVPWLKGKAAWVADYASYYQTSRHFIARSLNGGPDYFNQRIAYGDRFNVFKKDADVTFYLLIDVSSSKLWFYCLHEGKRILLKTYKVGLGRKDEKKKSGSLTPLGKYKLGSKIAIYKPAVMGYFQDRRVEMIRIFGTRWIPFEKEIENCTEKAKGLGIHGAPWIDDPKTGALTEDRAKIGQYDSDGCIRFLSEDIEELFSIVITKPTVVELISNFSMAQLPGIEE